MSATWQHSCRPAGSPGSRSMTSRSGLRGLPALVTVHWCTCSSRAARLTSQVRVARSSQIGNVRVSLSEDARLPVVGTVAVRTQDGVPAGAFFSKKLLPCTPCGQRIRVTARSRRCGSSTADDAGVVVEHLALGGAGARVEHLVEVADLERAAVDVDVDLVGAAPSAADRDHRRGGRVEPAYERAEEGARRRHAAGGRAAAVDVQEDPGPAVPHLVAVEPGDDRPLVLPAVVGQPLGGVDVAARQPPAEAAPAAGAVAVVVRRRRCPAPRSRRGGCAGSRVSPRRVAGGCRRPRAGRRCRAAWSRCPAPVARRRRAHRTRCARRRSASGPPTPLRRAARR